MIRMSDAEIHRVVESMNASPNEKAELLKQALRGDPSARFAVYGLRLRQSAK